MVSVIIPCYNAANFLKETLDSILVNGEEVSEIIIVDDGSKDATASVVKSYKDERIVYQFQNNKGVSSARNRGLALAKEELVIFFDADDKMSDGFLKTRAAVLIEKPGIDFCCGPVKTFPTEQKLSFGVAENVAETLLTYHPDFSSCPSNYLIRRSALIKNKVLFNEQLSSTADRFFLIQLAERSKGALIHEAPLLYRVDPGSMSNKLTRKLFEDNEQYLLELKKHKLIPESLAEKFFFRIHYILGLGFIRTGSYFKGIKYSLAALKQNPKLFINQIV